VGLFSRVFLSFWAAILAFALAAAAITILNFRAGAGQPREVIGQAAVVLLREGRPGLEAWLEARNARFTEQRTLILDGTGQDILGQRLPPRVVRRSPGPWSPGAAGPPQADDLGPPRPRYRAGNRAALLRGPPGSLIRAEDGTPYRVLFDPPPRRGPFSPPFAPWLQGTLVALAAMISGLVSYLLARSLTRPLLGLQGTAAELSRGRLAARTPAAVARRRDEIGALAREFDGMAGRLAALIEARAQLLRDLSHELRSPLARLQIAVGLARQQGSGDDGPLVRIEREGERLEKLIAQILEYARLERDPASLHRQPVDVLALVRQVALDAEYESQSPPGRIRVETGADASLPTLHADPQVLHSALDNVVRNALRHGGMGPVEIRADRADAELRLTVRDHGPGVPAGDLQRIFQPFYRVERPDIAAPTPGSGIGLAVAAKAVQIHGGHIEAGNAPGGGLLVTLRLPLPA